MRKKYPWNGCGVCALKYPSALAATANHSTLASVGARPYDLVVTGEKSSRKEDIDRLRRMRAIYPHARIVILAAESTSDDVIASICQCAYSYFSEPFSVDALVAMVRMAAEGPCWDDGIEVLSATSAWIRLLARCERKAADRLLQFFHEMAFLPRRRKGISCLRLPRNSAERDGTWRPLRPESVCRDRLRARTPYGGVPGQGSWGKDSRSMNSAKQQSRIPQTNPRDTSCIARPRGYHQAATASCSPGIWLTS